MFTKTTESTAKGGRGIVGAGNYDLDDAELEKLRVENAALKVAVEQVS
jgi:uncharacterized protein YaiE (UPF0345 family)